jgi:protein-disulfide isomerase
MSSTNKRAVLLVVWLAILGGLFALITRLNIAGDSAQPPPPPSLTNLTAANVQAQWPQIVTHASAPPRGPANAAYTLAEFGDFQCPQCGKMRPVVEALIARSGGKANLIFLHRPFPQMHPWAKPSAEASLAAAAQGKFWPMYDALYSHQDDLEPGYYDGYAADVGLNVAQFKADLAAHKYLPQVTQDARFADSLSVEVTPTLLVRDNATGKITIYIGADSTQPGAVPGFSGITQLAAAPPWKTAVATTQQ